MDLERFKCFEEPLCRTPLHEDSPQHHGHKVDHRVMPRTCAIVGEKRPSDPNVGEGPGR